VLKSQISLRAPTKSDISALARLGRDTFIETFGPLYKPADLQTFLTEAYSDQVVTAELADPRLIHQVIEHKNDLIAFIKIGPVHVPAVNPLPDAMEIWQLYLRQTFLGHGLGDLLMNWAFEQFAVRQAPEIYLSVFSENKRAIAFYQKYGFEKHRDYDFPVGEQIDLEWIMKKSSPSWE
jgi:ribosomal protein S18 acetylase RimI-like enzyme